MSSREHSPEAYRTLFALIGAGLQLTALIFILASALVAPWWVVVALSVLWVVVTAWSWLGFERRSWLPTAAGTLLAVVWIVAITVFAS